MALIPLKQETIITERLLGTTKLTVLKCLTVHLCTSSDIAKFDQVL